LGVSADSVNYRYPIITEPWHTIGIDIMGPFSTTSRQKRFLLVIVDYFTRWIELFPLKTTTSYDIAQIISNEVCSRYGIPSYILSDNGPQFASKFFKSFCETIGIKQKYTANYHPQSNMTERVNRTLKTMIAIFAQDHPNSWDKEIQKIAFAIRTSVNETTGETPAFMMFGRDPKTPLDLLLGEPSEGPPQTTIEETQINEYKQKLIHNLQCTFNLVREHSEVEKISQKMKYDKHTSLREFKVGDLVWISIINPQIGDVSTRRKLQPKYQGPCRLLEKLGPTTFTAIRISDGVNFGAINIDRMKKYFEPTQNHQNNTSNTSDQMIETNGNNNDVLSDEDTENDQEQRTTDRLYTRTTTNEQIMRPSRTHKRPARYLQ